MATAANLSVVWRPLKGLPFCLVEYPSLARRAHVYDLLSFILVFIVVFQIIVGVHGITRIEEEIA